MTDPVTGNPFSESPLRLPSINTQNRISPIALNALSPDSHNTTFPPLTGRVQQLSSFPVDRSSLALSFLTDESEEIKTELTPFKIIITSEEDTTWIEDCFDCCRKGGMSKTIGTEYGKGRSGSYLISDQDKICGFFKPAIEEPGAPYSKYKYDLCVKEGIEVETASRREVAAHLLFSKQIPPTAWVTLKSSLFASSRGGAPVVEEGSLQLFIRNARPWSSVSDKNGIQADIRDIALIDITLFNADRHGNNLFVKEGKLIPIDHGCILPANCATGARFCWYHELPLEQMFSEEQRTTIEKIDLEKNIKILEETGLSAGAINTHVISVLLAQKLCRLASIRDIAMYQLDLPSTTEDGARADGVFYESMTNSMLKMAALREEKNARNDSDWGRIDQKIIHAVVDEVTDFVESLKEDLRALLVENGCTKEEIEAIEGARDAFDQPIHVVNRVARAVLSDAVYNPSIGDWKQEVRESLDLEIAERINNLKN